MLGIRPAVQLHKLISSQSVIRRTVDISYEVLLSYYTFILCDVCRLRDDTVDVVNI